jgi:hemerythrin-like metal-binding protein
MAILEWDESISLHIPSIDAQHKELIGWINTLNDAVQKGEGARLIEVTLQKLINYVFEHFSAEEQLMLSYNFPGFTGHRQEHDFFVQKLKEIQGGFQDSDETSRKTLDFMVDWIVCHIKGTDQTYGRFILDRMGEPSV